MKTLKLAGIFILLFLVYFAVWGLLDAAFLPKHCEFICLGISGPALIWAFVYPPIAAIWFFRKIWNYRKKQEQLTKQDLGKN